LVNVCKVNKTFRKLCKDDIFWLNRTFNRFSSIITKEELKTYKNKFNTWKEYYVDLVDFLEKMYSNFPVFPIDVNKKGNRQSRGVFYFNKERKDLIKIMDEVAKNSEELNDLIIEEDYEAAKTILSKEFVNPNIFYSPSMDLFKEDDLDHQIIINILSKDHRFKPLIALSAAVQLGEKEAKIIMEKITPFLTWKQILEKLFEEIESGDSVKPKPFLDASVSLGATKKDIQKYVSGVYIDKEDKGDDTFNKKRAIKDINRYF